MINNKTQTRIALGFGAAGFILGLLTLWDSMTTPRPVAAAPEAPANPNAGWLKGSDDENFTTAERHSRGLDVSMAEIGYHYRELLIADKERNRDKAKYQTEKISLSLRLAVERRPKRARSAEPFLANDLPAVPDAVKSQAGSKLDAAFNRLR